MMIGNQSLQGLYITDLEYLSLFLCMSPHYLSQQILYKAYQPQTPLTFLKIDMIIGAVYHTFVRGLS